MVDKELLKILACPKCKGDLNYDEEKDILICEKCKVYYEVKEDIPILLPESAKPLSG
ncbi:MAG: Trm112 family protein [Aquifex sp.]|nr:MAG: Trm112 family protein [Aquifex sp.]